MAEFSLVQFKYRKTIPLSVPYLAYGLENANIDFDLKIFDVGRFFEPGTGRVNAFYELLTDTEEVIALGCFSDVLPYAIAALRKIKEEFPEKVIILGGVGPSSTAAEIMEAFDFVDFIIKGCGITPLPLLIQALRENPPQFGHVPRLLYRNEDRKICATEDDHHETTPMLPAYNKMGDMGEYDRFLIKTSTGCPYRCTFCYALPAAGRNVKYRDIGEVIEEIGFVKKMNGEKDFVLRILDEAFVYNRKRVIKFCELLKSENLEVRWVCYGRIDRMDEDLLKIMADAGCVEIYYGVESGSNRILNLIRKGFSTEESIRIVLLSKKYIPGVTTSFIYRFPFETLADFKETVFAIRYLQMKGITTQLHPLVPVRNSRIYSEYSKQLLVTENEPLDYLLSESLTFLPKECIDLVKSNPDVFYDYGHYIPSELDLINELISKNRDAIYTNVHNYWIF